MNYAKTKKLLIKRLGNLDGDRQYYASLLFDSLKRYCNAEMDVEKNGMSIQTNQRLFINPAVNIINESHKQIVKLLTLLNVKPNDDALADNPFKDVI